ncbi:MAG: hypothetical protein JXR40_00170 [Pontiellaceae bacterium]|nr:hypothetical protein [Pontiellaceae bacterium]
MKKFLLGTMLAGSMVAGASASTPIKAIVDLGSGEGSNQQVVDVRGYSDGQVWYGPSDVNKFGFHPRDISRITFDTREVIDDTLLEELRASRSYDEIIEYLEEAMTPYREYDFLPSSLNPYQAMLAELYYKTGQYEKSLVYSRMLANPDRDPTWPARCDEKTERGAYAYQGLALMELKRTEEAEALFALRGWTKDMSDDAPAEDLYITAKFLAMKEDYAVAIEVAAKVVVFNPGNAQWLRPAEVLCAQLYADLGMFDSSEEVIREILLMYPNTDEADEADQLMAEMDDLRAEWDQMMEEKESKNKKS